MPGGHDGVRELLLALLEEAGQRRSWHGTNLRGSIRGLSAAEADWRLGRHSIAEIVVHCAYWKYAVGRRLRGGKRGSFPLKGSNWFALPAPLGERDWRDCVELLAAQHAELIRAVGELDVAELHAPVHGRKTGTAMLIRGAALHDVYHAGQIQMIKRAGGTARRS